MNERPDQFDPQLDAYLDGLLDDEARAAFEARTAHEPALRDAVQRQRSIDAALRRSITPETDRLAGLIRRQASPGPRPRPGRRDPVVFWLKRIAAAVIIGTVLAWGLSTWQANTPPTPSPRYVQRDMVTIYHQTIADGFQPLWRCETEAEFIQTFQHRLGQPLTLASAPPGVENLGLAYANCISTGTVYLLARVDGQEVLVFIDRAELDAGHTVDPTAGLNLFRRQLGALVLYELTPIDRPHLLPIFETPPPSATQPLPAGSPGAGVSCPFSGGAPS